MDECEASFQELKEHLVDLPHLANLHIGNTLYLYLAVTDHVVSSILVKKDEGKIHWLVYYTRNHCWMQKLNNRHQRNWHWH